MLGLFGQQRTQLGSNPFLTAQSWVGTGRACDWFPQSRMGTGRAGRGRACDWLPQSGVGMGRAGTGRACDWLPQSRVGTGRAGRGRACDWLQHSLVLVVLARLGLGWGFKPCILLVVPELEEVSLAILSPRQCGLKVCASLWRETCVSLGSNSGTEHRDKRRHSPPWPSFQKGLYR